MLKDYMLDPDTDVKFPRCPVCGQECDTYYRDRDGEIFACENCVSLVDAYEFYEEEKDE